MILLILLFNIYVILGIIWEVQLILAGVFILWKVINRTDNKQMFRSFIPYYGYYYIYKQK